jgi:hypothetical protein
MSDIEWATGPESVADFVRRHDMEERAKNLCSWGRGLLLNPDAPPLGYPDKLAPYRENLADVSPCPEPPTEITVLHNDEGEIVFKLCERHFAVVEAVTDPHEGETLPEAVSVDPYACGLMTSRCCAYLIAAADVGFCCGRARGVKAAVDERLAAGEMKATRAPKLPYPLCQEEP